MFGSKRSSEYKILSKSKYFNKKWYLNKYDDVAQARVDPIEHYLNHGWKESRNPSKKFDTDGYLRAHPDCKINPLLHFEMLGPASKYRPELKIDETRVDNYWKKHDKLKNINKVIYSCMSGGYDEIIADFYPKADYDYVLFTDNKKLLKKGRYLWWQIRPLYFSESDSVRNARWHKTHPHVLFPEYDYSIWLDSNIQISGVGVYTLIEKHIKAKHKIAIALHPCRDCIYDEAETCILSGKDNPAIINKQMDILKADKYPKHKGLYETNVLLRKHMDPKIVKLCDAWWEFIKNYSRRDQLSFNYLLWKFKVQHFPIAKKSLRLRPDFRMIVHNYKPEVTEYKTNKMLVHLHLFYHDQLDWFLSKLKNVKTNYDLWVTVSETNSEIENKIKKFKPDANILLVPNRGYDVYPFWLVLQNITLSDYDVVLKIHTKNRRDTEYVKNGIHYIGNDWRNDLVNSLIGSKHVFARNLREFKHNEIGMVCCKNLIINSENVIRRDATKSWAEKLGITYSAKAPFCAGTMFMIRADILYKFQKYPFKAKDFATVSKTGDTQSLAHSLETMFGIMVWNRKKTIYGADTLGTKMKRLKVKWDNFKRKGLIKHKDLYYIKHSKYFDKKWYLQKYPDVAAARINPAKHYLIFGWKENRNPGPVFYTERYFQRNPDVLKANINPLLHYEKYGKYENRPLAPKKVVQPAFKINYKTYNDLTKDIKTKIDLIPSDVDLVVGVPRSGMLPAYMIGLALNKKVCSLPEFTHGILGNSGMRKTNTASKIKNVLVVDDTVNTGLAMDKVKAELKPFNRKYKFVYLAVYTSGAEATKHVDVALNLLPQPRMFQWNYLYHGFMSNACYDMDGVLCVDPTEKENDDGKNYIKFVKTARPLYLPNRPIGYIVTSRLEKYRKETEEWLAKNGVKYKKLYMFNGTAEERRRLGLHADFKANIYKQIKDSEIFIESNPGQAKRIAELTKKNVICCLNDTLYT